MYLLIPFQVVLAKRSASTPLTQYVFSPHPRDTTYNMVMIVDFSDQPEADSSKQIDDKLLICGKFQWQAGYGPTDQEIKKI